MAVLSGSLGGVFQHKPARRRVSGPLRVADLTLASYAISFDYQGCVRVGTAIQ
jgi:hypothetical protein